RLHRREEVVSTTRFTPAAQQDLSPRRVSELRDRQSRGLLHPPRGIRRRHPHPAPADGPSPPPVNPPLSQEAAPPQTGQHWTMCAELPAPKPTSARVMISAASDGGALTRSSASSSPICGPEPAVTRG